MSILTKYHEKLAELCQHVYTDDNLQLHDHIDACSGIQCCFVKQDNELIIVFRGSDESVDWYHNFIATRTEYPRGSNICVHSGFLSQVLSIKTLFRQKLIKNIEEANGSIEKITFTSSSARVFQKSSFLMPPFVCIKISMLGFNFLRYLKISSVSGFIIASP